ncbi:MAG: biotin/lipoyl-binding protein, partial [Alistipes sp.]|nr:biotin/lipoyl-binding protein [Alistipes sp.]
VPAAPKAVVGNKIVAPLPGRVISIKVKVGDTVNAGDEVVVLEAMKMENSITSDYSGTVQQVLAAEGDNVATDAVLMIVG